MMCEQVHHNSVVVWPGYIKPKSAAELWDALVSVPEHPDDEEIKREGPLRRIRGSHPSLRYRGNAIKRHKIWFQDGDVDGGLRRYLYTGWSWPIALATRHASEVPVMKRLFDFMNATPFAEKFKFNHAIFTWYKDGDDNIGAHHDKMRDIQEGSWIVVIKLGGASRSFAFYDKDTNEEVWRKTLEPGTAVVMNSEGNAAVKHGVPVDGTEVGPSGSIVLRCIKTEVPWAEVEKRAAKTNGKRKTRD